MILILCAWIFHFFLSVSLGYGLLWVISKVTRQPVYPISIFYQFWVGFIVLIGLLQIVSLFVPVNKYVFAGTSILALTVAAFNAKLIMQRVGELFNELFTTRGVVLAVISGILLLVIAYSANREVLHSDTFIYHYNAVKWAREYPAVPGLANLHSRLGFNSSFFLFAAFTEMGMYYNHSAHIAVSFMMAVCSMQWLFVIASTRETITKRIFCMMTFLFLLLHIISQIDITSLSTDYPMAVVCLVFCLVLLDKTPYKNLLLLSLAAVAFSFKLSGMLTIAFALLVFVFAIAGVYRSDEPAIARAGWYRSFIASFVFFSLLVAGFVARNIVVSGWLVYPFPIGNLHLPWSVPEPYVLDLMAWIKSYPKIPGGVSPAVINEHGFLFWFTQWFPAFKLQVEADLLFGSLFILAWSALQVKKFGRFLLGHTNEVILTLFAFASIAFWFTSAPELRFGSIYFFLFFAASVVLFYQGSRYKPILKILIGVLFIGQIIYRMPSYVFHAKPKLFTFEYTRQPKLRQVVGSPTGETPELMLYMPAEGDACGNSPLPCTPYAGGYLHNHRLIKQRVPGDISKGFLPTE